MEITKEGYKKLIDEFNQRYSVTRKQLIEDLNSLKNSFSYNGEGQCDSYECVLFDIKQNDKRMKEIEKALYDVIITDDNVVRNVKVIQCGHSIKIEDVTNDEIFIIELRSDIESDPANDILSVHSPLGCELIGKKVHDVIKINEALLRILDIKSSKEELACFTEIPVAV